MTARRTTVARVTVAVAVLAVAATVALWPRDDTRTPTLRPQQAVDVEALRTKAGLAPCPTAAGWAARDAATVATGADATAAGPPGAGAPPRPPVVADSPLVGLTAPCLGGGADVPMADALVGETTVLNVWSHTCEPCRDELPALQEYAARPGAARVLGVQVDGAPEAGLAILTALGVRLPSISDPTGDVRAALQAPPVLPLTYVVTPDGGVRMVNPPVVFRSADEIETTVRAVAAG